MESGCVCSVGYSFVGSPSGRKACSKAGRTGCCVLLYSMLGCIATGSSGNTKSNGEMRDWWAKQLEGCMRWFVS